MSIFNFGTSTPGLPSLGSQSGGFGGWPSSTTQSGLNTQPLNFTSAPPLTSTAPASSLFSFGGGASTTSSATTTPAFNFGTPPAPTTTAPLNFGGGGIASVGAAPQQPLAQTSETAATGSPFSFGGGSVVTSSTPSAGQTQTVGISAAPVALSAQPSGFGFGSGTPSSVASNAATSLPSSIAASTALGSTIAAGNTGISAAATNINFRQLQEQINKWSVDIEEQERDFIEQATKVNYWDKTLMANADKISKLSDGMERVKVEHTRLEHELDFVKNAQKDFEAFIESLEAALPPNVIQDPERLRMYSLTEKMDTELQQMSEDLKEIIRHINESNKLVDRTDPVSQILRILNEHTDSLQWIEDHSNAMKNVLEDVTQMHQVFRRDHERSLKLMFKYN